MKQRTPLANPFYVALLVMAAVFAVTGAAYALWLAGVFEDAEQAGHPLVLFLRTSGERWLLIELAVIAVLTFASLATDEWWRGKDSEKHRNGALPDNPPTDSSLEEVDT